MARKRQRQTDSKEKKQTTGKRKKGAILRSDLLEALERVKMPLTEGRLIQFAGLLIFEDDLLVSYGDNISVSVMLETGVKAAIKYEKFMKLIKKIKDDEILLEVNDKQLVVKYGKKSKASFALIAYDQDKIPNLGVNKIEKMLPVPEGFADSLGFCCFSAGGDSGIELFDNVKIDKDKIVSTDKLRITIVTLSEKIKLKEPILIPGQISQFLSKFNIDMIAVDNSCVHYQDVEGTIFTHRLIDSKDYPGAEQFINIKGKKIEFPNELMNQLDQAKQIVEDNEDVEITIDKKEIVVKALSTDAVATLSLDHKYKGKKIKIEVSPDHLLQILSKSNKAIVNDDMICFKGSNFIHLISLI